MSLPLRTVVRAGDLHFFSGQVGHVAGTLVEGGVRAQADAALKNLVDALTDAGLTAGDVVKTTVYLTSMGDYAEMNEAYSAVFTTEPPARTAVCVSALPLGALIEIEAVAWRP